jgi:hypothetical protein
LQDDQEDITSFALSLDDEVKHFTYMMGCSRPTAAFTQAAQF